MSVEYNGEIYSIKINEDGLNYLNLSNLEINDISEIENLENLTQLQVLDLRGNELLEIKNLDSLTQLQELYLGRNLISEIKNLFTLNKLQMLDLSGNNILEIKNLENLTTLQDLNLESNRIVEIKNLRHLTQLQKLNLGWNRIAEIRNLEPLIQLRNLNLESNRIVEIKDLDPLTQLQTLNLGTNQITEIKNLETLTQLQELILWENQIAEIKSLETLSQLQELDLESNQITEIKNLDHLTQLKLLNLADNQIAEIKNLDALLELQKLYLYNNKIAEVKNFERLTQLQKLNLGGNQIAEIKNLEPLSQLQELSLWENQITEIKNLDHLTQLKLLNLADNQIAEIKNLDALLEIQELDLNNNRIKEVKGLENLKYLFRLELKGNPLPYSERFLFNASISEIQKFCMDKKEHPKTIDESKIAKINEYKIFIENGIRKGTIKEEDLIDLGTWRENPDLKRKQNSWFLAINPEEIPLNEKDASIKEIKIYMIQLHELQLSYSFNPIETKVSHFKSFVKMFWKQGIKKANALIYDETDKLSLMEKIFEILELIFRDSGKNKLIIFPENTLPESLIEELEKKVEKFLNTNEDAHVILIGGVEHIKTTKSSSFFEDLSLKSIQKHKKHIYSNRTVIIDNLKAFQEKQTPVVIKDKVSGDIQEDIWCNPFPKIKIFGTTFGRIAIFICKDFLRLQSVISDWVKENQVDFIVVPSLSSKILPFNYQVMRIFNEQHDPKLKIIYVNVGEYGGSEFYSRDRMNEIEYNYQKNFRDNVGEVIVTRICKLHRDVQP